MSGTRPLPYRDERGFTVVEMAVSVLVFSLIIVTAFNLMANLGRATVRNDTMARTQSNARAALDQLASDLRSAGAEIDYAGGQRRFVYADPYQIMFNANLMPLLDTNGNGLPAAIEVSASNAGVPSDANALYVPNNAFGTGAETVVLSLDSNMDGVVNSADRADDDEEDSENPRDYVLYRGVYGWDGTANQVNRQKVAVVRGPEPDGNGNRPTPLFQYLIDTDDDRATAPVLFGDGNGDGTLSQAEIATLAPLTTAAIARIERILIGVTAEPANPDARVMQNDGYLAVELNTEIQVRQEPRTTAVVHGTVFRDTNSDGIMQVGEPTISGVEIRSSSGRSATSNSSGQYVLTLSPGQMTITEIDPTGYASSTSNVVSVDLYAGAFQQVDFGDYSSSGIGAAYGVVFHDEDEDQVQDAEESGLGGVKVYADTGEQTYSNADGSYWLDVPVGTRIISQVDEEGFISTTPSSVEVVLDSNGDTAEANFGDKEADDTGTIQGYVFLDENQNGMRDGNEGGVPGAEIFADAYTTESDNQGFFSMTVPTGNYSVSEVDPPGYTSTTTNRHNGVNVDADEVINLYFGDMIEEDIEFDVIELADTERALSIESGDLGEDNRGDADLVLGTRFSGGQNNLLVWENERRNSRTPNSAIFDSSPAYSRPNSADVTNLSMNDFNGDSEVDAMTGLSNPLGSDVNIWLNVSGGLPEAPNAQYTASSSQTVADSRVVDFDKDGNLDFAIAVIEGEFTGHVEVWRGDGSGAFSYQATISAGVSGTLGRVTALDVGDINGDGWDDLVVGAVDYTQQSTVHAFLQVPAMVSFGTYIPFQSFSVYGSINDLALVDMVEDGDGDLDLLIASEHWDTAGGIEQWNMGSDFRFGMVTESGRSMDDWMPTGGSPVAMRMANLDNDVFPDIIVGTRTASYEGTVEIARTFGFMPSAPQLITESSIGTVMTMTVNDFNLDNAADLAVGTQNSGTSGKVFIFYQQ